MNIVPIGPLVTSIAPPPGGVWMKARAVPAEVQAAPWRSGHADSGGHGITFSYRTVNAGDQKTYMQLYANDQYLTFVNGKFSATMLSGVPSGLGALTDDAVQSAAGSLMTELQSSGCQAGFDPTVQAFQNAYISAGGNLPNDSDGSSGADGLYGANTQAALQAVLNAGPNQPPQQAPAGCVGTAGGGGTSPTVIPAQTITGTVPSTSGNAKWILIGAGVLGAGIIGYAVYRKQKKVRVVHLRKV